MKILLFYSLIAGTFVFYGCNRTHDIQGSGKAITCDKIAESSITSNTIQQTNESIVNNNSQISFFLDDATVPILPIYPLGADINLDIDVPMANSLSKLPSKKEVDNFIDFFNNRNGTPSSGDIIVIYVDTLRYDYIKQYAPHVSKFLSENISAKNIANASATAHSTFSLFHSQPSFLAYYEYLDIDSRVMPKGSIFLKILQKYHYELYAIGGFFHCLDENFKERSNDFILLSFFETDTSMLKDCQDKSFIAYPETIDLSKKSRYYFDHLTVNRFKEVFNQRQAAGDTNKAFYWLGLLNVHTPYSWADNNTVPFKHIDELYAFDIVKMLQSISSEYIKLSYANSISSMDNQFNDIINYLKRKGVYDDVTIVFISDHGESLGEKKSSINSDKYSPYEQNNYMFVHGTSTYREQIETPFGIKLPSNRHYDYVQRLRSATIYGLDLFPTLFDSLGIDLNPLPWFIKGKSLFSSANDKRSTVVTLPAGLDSTNKLALVNDDYKVQIQITDKDYYNASSFKIINITDLDDNTLIESLAFKDFCIDIDNGTIGDPEGLIIKIKDDFKEALDIIFGTQTVKEYGKIKG